MKMMKFIVLALAVVLASGIISAQEWPVTSPQKLDTMNMRMSIIKGMPDSVVTDNPLIFADQVDDDEFDIYVLNKYLGDIRIMSTMLSSDPDVRGRHKAYANVVLLNDKGEQVKKITTDQGGSGFIDVQELGIPDGIYRLRVDYGARHTKNGTKPKARTALRVYPSIFDPDSPASRGHGRFGRFHP